MKKRFKRFHRGSALPILERTKAGGGGKNNKNGIAVRWGGLKMLVAM